MSSFVSTWSNTPSFLTITLSSSSFSIVSITQTSLGGNTSPSRTQLPLVIKSLASLATSLGQSVFLGKVICLSLTSGDNALMILATDLSVILSESLNQRSVLRPLAGVNSISLSALHPANVTSAASNLVTSNLTDSSFSH